MPCPEVAAVSYIRPAKVLTLFSVEGDAQVEQQNTVVGFLTQMVVRINLLQPRVRAATSGVGTVSYSEPVMKRVRSDRALSHVACNVVRVAARFGYTSDESFGSRERVQQC